MREEVRQAELGQDRARLRDARPRLAEPAPHALEAGESDVAVRLDEAVAVCALEDLLAAADPLLHGQRPPQRGRGEPAQDPSLLAGIAGTTGVDEPALEHRVGGRQRAVEELDVRGKLPRTRQLELVTQLLEDRDGALRLAARFVRRALRIRVDAQKRPLHRGARFQPLVAGGPRRLGCLLQQCFGSSQLADLD